MYPQDATIFLEFILGAKKTTQKQIEIVDTFSSHIYKKYKKPYCVFSLA